MLHRKWRHQSVTESRWEFGMKWNGKNKASSHYEKKGLENGLDDPFNPVVAGFESSQMSQMFLIEVVDIQCSKLFKGIVYIVSVVLCTIKSFYKSKAESLLQASSVAILK